MTAEGFKGHVATDDSLLGTAGKSCGWSVGEKENTGKKKSEDNQGKDPETLERKQPGWGPRHLRR